MSDPDVERIEGLIADLQAEISALKQLMLAANPQLANAHQTLVDKLREGFHRARDEQKRNRP